MSAGGYHPHHLPSMDEDNKKINALLQRRQAGYFDYVRSSRDLIEMGVKMGDNKTGELTVPDSFEKYIDKFNLSNLEFEWEVEYINGSKLSQFEGGNQHNFKHIDKSQIKKISYISNFIWPVDREENRVIVTLDWETGLFEFTNGFADVEVRNACCGKPVLGEKKLVLFKRTRMDNAMGSMSEDSELAPLLGDYFIYNRFVLGFVSGGIKRMVIISPSGLINLFNEKL